MKQLLLIISFFSITVIAFGQRSDSSEEQVNRKEEVSERKKARERRRARRRREASEQKAEINADTVRQPETKERTQEKPAEEQAPQVLEKDTVAHQKIDSPTVPQIEVDTTITPLKITTGDPATPMKPAITATITKKRAQDSLKVRETRKALQDTLFITQRILKKHPFFNFKDKAAYPPYKKNIKTSGKENEFYTIAALLLLFATFKAMHEKYFSDLKDIFVRRNVKHRQTKQQLVQNSLPSFLFNLFFILVLGFYISLIVNYLSINPGYPFWELFGYSAALIALFFLIKYLIIKLIGWIFHIKTLTNNYLFLIFLINKVIAVILLPLIIMIALGGKELSTVGWTLSWVAILSLFLYRYSAAIRLVSRDKKVALFYYLIYAGAFEIFPLVMLYKGILFFLK